MKTRERGGESPRQALTIEPTAQRYGMLQKKAFIGVSLGSRLFTRDWVRFAYEHILHHHDRLLVVIADELWLYTRLVADERGPFLSHATAVVRMGKIRDEMTRLFESCRSRLSKGDSQRIEIASWSTYSNAQYAHILRVLRSSAIYLRGFSSSVDISAKHHVRKLEVTEPTLFGALAASRDYILDEMAMCLHITELAGFAAEYHPGDDLTVLRELYAGHFAEEGLTVEALVGNPAQRVFTNLQLPVAKAPSKQGY